MNVMVSCRAEVSDVVLDELARNLPGIVSKIMEVPGGNVARLRPEQVSLIFSTASSRDTGADIRIMAFAKNNPARKSTEKDLAAEIVREVVGMAGRDGGRYSVHVRLYLTEIGGAEHGVAP